MEVKITYALRHKRKIPTFREYTFEEVSKSPRLIQEEIANYERLKGLKIVYEESEEESDRKDTLQSAEDHF